MPRSQSLCVVRFALVFVVAGIVAAPPARSQAESGSARPATRVLAIGGLFDLRGGQASLGQPMLNGFRLALQQADTAKGLLPSSIVVDTATDPGTTRAAAARVAPLVAVGVGFSNNASVLEAGPAFQALGVPFVTPGATGPELPAEVGDVVFLACFGDDAQAFVGAAVGRERFGPRAALLWDAASVYARGLAGYFREAFIAPGGLLTEDAAYGDRQSFATLARQVATSSPPPDFVYLAAEPEGVGRRVAALRQAGFRGPVLGGDGLDTPELMEAGPGTPSQVYFTTHVVYAGEGIPDRVKRFVADYRAAYGTAPADAFAALGYDAARLVLDVGRRAESPTADALRKALEATRNFPGVTGEISYGPGRHVPRKTVWVVEVQEGRRRLLERRLPPER